MNKKYVPFCVGEYKNGDVSCDGDEDGDEFAKKPCSWRNRCGAFREYVKRTDNGYQRHITLVPDSELHHAFRAMPIGGRKIFIDFCDSLAIKYNVAEGKIIHQTSVKKNVPLKKARRAAVKRSRAKAHARKITLDALFEHFKLHFIENLVEYKFTPPKGIIKPGRLYLIDKKKSSKYVSIYCKEPGTLGQPVVLIRFKPRTMTFDIELPMDVLDYDGVGIDVMKKIHPAHVDDGRFKTICTGMDKECVALVAQLVAKMIKRGKINLPSPG
jgi:hypothetical protein